MDSARPEKGSVRITRHVGKGAVHRERQAAEEKVEEKVRRLSRAGGRGYIDGAAGIRRQAADAKAARRQRDAQNGHAKPEGVVGFPHGTGGGGRQSGGSMGADSGAPLTGTTYTVLRGLTISVRWTFLN